MSVRPKLVCVCVCGDMVDAVTMEKLLYFGIGIGGASAKVCRISHDATLAKPQIISVARISTNDGSNGGGGGEAQRTRKCARLQRNKTTVW